MERSQRGTGNVDQVINKLKSYADQIKALKGVEVTTQPLKDLGDTFVLSSR
jgi:hypothetical protein